MSNINDKYYHFTSYFFMDNINIFGLVPFNGSRCQSINDERRGVFLSKGIDNTIVMYALMLGYYNKYNSDIGILDRLQIENEIACLEIEKLYSNGLENDYYTSEINRRQKYIEGIDNIRSYDNFISYLNGCGCFLSVSGLDDVDTDNPTDCCYKKTIPTSKISMVGIKNKITGEYITDREAVLSYFINLYSIDHLLCLVDDENKKDILGLYNTFANYKSYGPSYFDLCEIPINCMEKPKEKTLTGC